MLNAVRIAMCCVALGCVVCAVSQCDLSWCVLMLLSRICFADALCARFEAAAGYGILCITKLLIKLLNYVVLAASCCIGGAARQSRTVRHTSGNIFARKSFE